jgi:Ca-activated chloride channel family protein
VSDTNGFSNDPRLTAYALGELDGAERAEIEALLAKDEDARRVVEEIRATAALVSAEMAGSGAASLTEAQRAAVAAKANRVAPVHRMSSARWLIAAASVAAAATIVASTTWWKPGIETAAVPIAANDDADGDIVMTRSENLYDSTRSTAEVEDASVPGTANATFTLAGGSGANGDFVPSSSTSIGEDGFKREESAQDGGRGGESGLVPGGGGGGGGTRRAGSVVSCPEPNAPGGSPSGGTSIGVGAGGGHFGGGRAPRTGGGKSGGGLGQAPNGPQRRRMRGPAGETPPASRDPSDPAPPPEAGGPSTPGGGPTTGGPDASGPTVDDYTYPDNWAEHPSGSSASYAHVEDNPFRLVKDTPLSTFGVDVDTASYSNVRRFLTAGQLPPPGAVRIEEMVNYFPYEYAPPTDGRPFAVRVDVAGCPWKTDHRLVRVAIKGKVVATAARPAANLVFLLDVSGSMQPANRLALVLQSMKLLVGQLEPRDRVAIVVYAGESGLALPSTSCEDKAKILATLDSLHAGGSTNGASGIQLAYDIAAQNHIDGGVNRVILATDGDFNVGVTDQSSLVKLVQEKAKAGTFLSVLGVGDDNYQDSTMEMLADRGNGNYAYIDTLKEGEKALVAQASGTLVTIAKDVKLQIEFNPSQVGAYRLIGYENRVLAAEDFKDDKKDAGEIGAGHTVTALYELAPPGSSGTETAGVDPLKYQTSPATTGGSSNELLTVKLRWKEPASDVSTPMEVPVVDEGITYSSASPDFKFAASVALFGMCLRQSPHRGNGTLAAALELATEGTANDPGGHRAEFVTLIKRAAELGAK